ncbi:CHAD domain-containing protein [Mesorhizobium retamae]|uniref:CHAD domain-containing protein n=1 Tax=Mesorhizobium retamae TaxID=2912854 RepID=A0ABS9QDP2_9HYPH|nr:CHAD domain-containing protein [Mesorhizobium sp. IRAMC:0171]MCG7505538.1 CHAD domain-containing protein [Mesorhizobium sp. IRAMC:0171]
MSVTLDANLPLANDAMRLLRQDVHLALDHLAQAHIEPEEHLHKCRRRLKAVRAVLRLVRPGDETFFKEENARYRDVAASLAGPREATALIETVDRLAGAHPHHADIYAGLRAVLLERRDVVMSDISAFASIIDAATATCRQGLLRIGALSLPADPNAAAAIVAEGVQRGLDRAKKALTKARSRGEEEDFHDLRKAVKVHAAQLDVLGKLWPGGDKARRKALNKLGGKLGELNDLAVLDVLLKKETLVSPEARTVIEKDLKDETKRLRKESLAGAKDLFEHDWKRKIAKLTEKLRLQFSAISTTTLWAA